MTLPRVLAGPIVRRVEPTSCSFWIATSDASTVTASIYAGTRAAAGSGAAFAASEPTALTQFGQHFYAGVIQIKLTPDSGNPSLAPGSIYSYDLAFSGGAGASNLEREGLLEEREGTGGAPRQLPLGYVTGRLPSFVTPPATLSGLRLAHASCRKTNGTGPDALAWLDRTLEESFGNQDGARPQQLVLTGDQIYADDVSSSLLPMLNALGRELLGYDEQLTVEGGSDSPRWAEVHRATLANFPALRRSKLVRESARMSSTACENHLLSFGEFAAMYLAAWSPRVWRTLATDDELFRAVDGGVAASLRSLLTDWESRHTGGATPQAAWREARRASVEAERERTIAFRDAVPKVARVLANVATYMIWDDHEITDDWNLNKRWRNRVLPTTLGKDIIRNGGMAYAIFQGWGNDPAAFAEADSPNKQLLDDASALLRQDSTAAAGGGDGAEPSLLTKLNVALGLTSEPASKQAKWHYKVPGPRHQLVVLDTRTRRSYRGEGVAPPKLLGDSLNAQLAAGPFTEGRELLILVSPVPVLAPSILEQFAAPIYELVADAKYGFEHAQRRADHPQQRGGAVTGVEDADAESWGADEPAREELLKRLASYQRAIILSGDVHYGCSLSLDFWTGTNPTPARIVQLTSSPSRNSFSDLVESVLRSNAALQMYQRGLYPERLAWNDKAAITLPPGAQIKPGRRSRMRRKPALVPARGWPAGAAIEPDKHPDWRWRLKLVRDERPDAELPLDAQQVPLEAGSELVVGNASTHLRAYRAVAARHQREALAGNFRQLRQMVFKANIGLVTVSGDGSSLSLEHTLLSRVSEMDDGEPNTVHRIALAPASEPAPILQVGS